MGFAYLGEPAGGDGAVEQTLMAFHASSDKGFPPDWRSVQSSLRNSTRVIVGDSRKNMNSNVASGLNRGIGLNTVNRMRLILVLPQLQVDRGCIFESLFRTGGQSDRRGP
jgi:hypothetical protein